MVLTKSVYWATDNSRPAWAINAPPSDQAAALRRIIGLLRLGSTVPGLSQFFTDTKANWNVFTRGQKTPWKRAMTGREALKKWSGSGYPIVRGALTLAKGCVTLPANADGKPAAPAAPPEAPHLLKICVDKKLEVSEIETLIFPRTDETPPSVEPGAPAPTDP